MNPNKVTHLSDELFRPELFEVRDLQDEIRVDELCGRLLRFFYLDLVEQENVPEIEAGALAHGADYFLREFVIPDRQENLFALKLGRVRQFAATWYIIRTVEPNLSELGGILAGVMAFYSYCRKLGRITDEQLAAIEAECRDLSFYEKRIEAFWAIEGDGYFAWLAEVPLEK